jgi:hypothetical protein
MPHDDRRDATAGCPIVAMNITAAYTACLNPKQDFASTGPRQRNINNLKAVVLRQQKRFHNRMVAPIRIEIRSL